MKDSLIIFGAKYLVVFVVLMVIVTGLKLSRKKQLEFLASLIIAGAIAGLLVKLLSKLYFNPRPFVSGHIQPLFAHAADNGFPSEHASYAATIAAVIYFYRKKFAAVAAILTVLVGLSRVLAHVHSPVDILAGLAVGVVAGYAGYYLGSRFVKR